MKLFLPQRKVEKIVQMSQYAMGGNLTLRELKRLLGVLTSTIQAILTRNISPFPSADTNTGPEENMTNESAITLDHQAKEEVSWWITNMKTYHGKSLLI